jgi:hypothetical protein
MRFKMWLEVMEPFSPKGVRTRRYVKDQDTIKAQPLVQFQWKTRLGNVVKVQFEEKGDETYNVVFYVNDTLYDDASKVDGSRRDAEILPGVFDIAHKKADQLAIQKLTFKAHQSEGDTKIVKGVEEAPRVQVAIKELSRFEAVLRSHRPQMVPPSASKLALFQKLNKPMPQPEADFDAKPWLNLAANVQAIIGNPSQQNGGYALIPLIDSLKTTSYMGKFGLIGYDASSLIARLEDVANAQMSNSQSGWRRTENRRAAIYTKLVQKYFGDGWTISIRGDRFEITRNGSDA